MSIAIPVTYGSARAVRFAARLRRCIRLVMIFWLVTLLPISARAGGPFGFDSEVPLDTNGIWARKYQTGLENGVIAVEIAGALWFGNDDKLGHAFWQDIDSAALKYAFSRARPYQGDNPNAFFKGRCCQRFPSGEVTLQAAFVTPLIVDYYKQTPWIWALEALPVYDSIARLKSQAHWQSDVIVGGLWIRLLDDEAQHADICADPARRRITRIQ